MTGGKEDTRSGELGKQFKEIKGSTSVKGRKNKKGIILNYVTNVDYYRIIWRKGGIQRKEKKRGRK